MREISVKWRASGSLFSLPSISVASHKFRCRQKAKLNHTAEDKIAEILQANCRIDIKLFLRLKKNIYHNLKAIRGNWQTRIIEFANVLLT